MVTGGLGYIGSHTVVELQKRGFTVVIIDSLVNSENFILQRIEHITGIVPKFYEVDMCDVESLIKVFKKEGIFDAIIHFAAFKSVGESVKLPLKYFQNNLISLMNLLKCMEVFQCISLLFSSSATVYGDPEELPVKETTSFKKTLSAYGSTKQMGEDILEKVAMAEELKVISLRYFNPVGAHESALIGELPLGSPNNLMPVITQTGIGKIEKLTVWGNDYSTPDGTCIRDYIHVVDLAKADLKSCERLLNLGTCNSYEVFNIGTGIGYSVMTVIKEFEKQSKIKLNYKIGNRRPGDAAVVYADVSKANKILEWKAEAKLEDMVSSAWNWEKALYRLRK